MASLQLAGLQSVRLDLGHTGIVRGILELAPLSAALVDDLLASLNAKDVPALRQQASELSSDVRSALLALTRLKAAVKYSTKRAASCLRPALFPLPSMSLRRSSSAVAQMMSRSICRICMDTATRRASHLRCTPRALRTKCCAVAATTTSESIWPCAPWWLLDLLRELAELPADDPPHAILAPAGGDQGLQALMHSCVLTARSWFSALTAKLIAPKKANSYSIASSSAAVRRGK